AMKRNDEVVSASEIASWGWCPESWRLSALGAEPENRAAMKRGEGQKSKNAQVILDSEGFYRFCCTKAAKAAHPDSGGSEATFKRLQSAKALLDDHFKTAVNQ